MHSVTLIPEVNSGFEPGRLTDLALEVLKGEEAPAGTLAVLITDDARIHELNLRHRNVDAPTDVLSFSYIGSDFPSPDGGVELGDVVISLPTAASQAVDAGIDLADELDHLLVHGILHVLGHDHEEEADARRMHARESLYVSHDLID